MKKQYLVVVLDMEDKLANITYCKSNDELATLLMNIDDKRYMISDISVIDEIQTNPKDYCRKEPNLEIGGNQK